MFHGVPLPPDAESPSVFSRLRDWLTQRQVPHEILRHEPVYTSEEAARVRGTSLSSGAKALVCKVDADYVLIVLPADRKLEGKKFRRHVAAKSLRFATREEVLQLTTLQPGSIPPFGSLFGLVTYCDRRLQQEPVINFNAGDHALSMQIPIVDYLRVENPRIGDFAEDCSPRI